MTPPAIQVQNLDKQLDDIHAVNDVSFAVILLWSAIFFFIGQRRLQKRFA